MRLRLDVGELYFLVAYTDRDDEMVFPEIDSVIFIGKDVHLDEASRAGFWCFQDVRSYLALGSAADDGEPTTSGTMDLVELRENQVETMIFDEEGLAEVIGQCRQRRRALRHLKSRSLD
jgi:hypothetical protein